jgi:alpha-beta hydrolase superfamily lysophospholipase
MLFEDPLFEQWGTRALFAAPAGGAEFGECVATAARIAPGDVHSWRTEWVRTADRVLAWGSESSRAGHRVSASGAYLRASNYLRTAAPFLYGRPVSSELRDLTARSNAAFARGLELGSRPVTALEIPFEGTTLPGLLVRASDAPGPRPLLLCNNGYDSLMGEMWFQFGLAGAQRGYDVLLFDGPGQGAALTERGLFLRPDWEVVINAVVDHAVTLDGVDTARIALMGWSLGGYLVPRGASGEPRLAAAVADPGLIGMNGMLAGMLRHVGLTEVQANDPGALDDAALAPITAAAQSPALRWSLVQRGLMAHGVDTIPELIRTLATFSLAGRVEQIRCPMLVTSAEGDALAGTAATLYDQLTVPKRFVEFREADGAGGHCEMQARQRFQAVAFDWLDETLA